MAYHVESGRFKLYAFNLAFTVIVLSSLTMIDTNAAQNEEASKADKGWTVALSVIKMILLLVVLTAHVATSLRIFIGTRIEGIIIGALVVFSTILVSTITSPDRGLAVDKDGAIYSGNMYYFGWASFINGIVIASSYIESVYGIHVRNSMRSNSTSFTYWVALLAAMLVEMGTSSNIYNRNCDIDNKPQPFCQRTVLAISIGTIGVVLSLMIVVMKMVCGAAPFLFEAGTACFLFAMCVMELVYVTDAQGPGSALGNLYYFSWLSFLLTLMVGKACHEEYIEAQQIVEQQQQTANQSMPTLENVVDDIDDDGEEKGLRKISDEDEVDI